MRRIRGIEHIGITVPDHDAAVQFFESAFAAKKMFSQTDFHDGAFAAKEVHGMNDLRSGTRILKVSMLRLQNGPNIELFEIDKPGGTLEPNIADYGISHFSVNVDDIDAATNAFQAAGGTLVSEPYALGPPEEGSGNRGVFGRAPWGLLIEIEQLPSPMNYPADAEASRWLPEGE